MSEILENEAIGTESEIQAVEAPVKVKGRVTMIIGIVLTVLLLVAFGFYVYSMAEVIILKNTATEGWEGLGVGLGMAVMLLFGAILGIVELPVGIPGLILSIVTAARGKSAIRTVGVITAILNAVILLITLVSFVVIIIYLQ